MNLPAIVKKFLETYEKPRYRDWRGHYASGALSDLRDQYWKRTGEKETNPPDFKGSMTMSIGNWVEAGLVKDIFAKLHLFNVHLIETQVPVGSSNPNWDGYLDVLLSERIEGKLRKPLVIEIKTKHGYGADLLLRELEPSVEYAVQLGLYLKDLHSKGVTSNGMLFYVLLSDNNFGVLLSFNARYLPKTDEVEIYEACLPSGEIQEVDFVVKVGENSADRWKKLDKAVATKKVPSPDYEYKKELTPEFLSTVSDNQLRKAIAGEKILGDWQVVYSRFFDKIIETDNLSREYTEHELSLLRAELASRKKVTKTRAAAKRKSAKAVVADSNEDADAAERVEALLPPAPPPKTLKDKVKKVVAEELHVPSEKKVAKKTSKKRTRPVEVDADAEVVDSIRPRKLLTNEEE